jgi:small-conductance mechanosensitive channel
MTQTMKSPQDTSATDETFEPVLNKFLEFLDFIPESVQPVWLLIEQHSIIAAFGVALLFLCFALSIRFFIAFAVQKLTANTETKFDDQIVKHLRKPVFVSVLFFGFTISAQVAQLPFGTDTLVNIFISVIVVSWIRATFSLSTSILVSLGRVHDHFPIVEPRTIPLLDLSSKLIVILVGSYCLLLIWGINPLGWLASAGIVGIAVGFAAKDTLANLFSGFFILVDSPYKIGDYVNLDSGERGRVTHIGLRSTRLISREDIEITLPNAVIANAKIVNESGGPTQSIRIGIKVGAAYGSDVDVVCSILKSIGDEHTEVLQEPSPRVRLRQFGASALDFELLGWIHRPEDRGRVKHEILMAIYKQFREQNIEIPYSKTDVYIKELPSK